MSLFSPCSQWDYTRVCEPAGHVRAVAGACVRAGSKTPFKSLCAAEVAVAPRETANSGAITCRLQFNCGQSTDGVFNGGHFHWRAWITRSRQAEDRSVQSRRVCVATRREQFCLTAAFKGPFSSSASHLFVLSLPRSFSVLSIIHLPPNASPSSSPRLFPLYDKFNVFFSTPIKIVLLFSAFCHVQGRGSF